MIGAWVLEQVAVLKYILFYLKATIPALSGLWEFIDRIFITGTYYPYFLQGALTTLIISIITVFFGTIIGLCFALLKRSKHGALRGIATAYIEIMRGTPALLQISIAYYGLSSILPIPEFYIGNLDMSRVIPGCIALALNSGAYVAEIFRSGIAAVNIGQTEAAYSLGMPPGLTMREVVLPQAIRNILPALGNEFVTVIKESSILSVISIGELMFNTALVQGATYIAMEPLIVAGVLYFIMTFTTSRILAHFEKRMSKGVRKVSK